MSAKKTFGTVIATVLLFLYVYLAVIALRAVGCAPSQDCREFTEQMGSSLSLLGGLVAAPIIAELALTKAGEIPLQRALGSKAKPRAMTLLKVLVVAYFVIWVAVGLLALLAGWRHPTEIEALTTLGNTWLGLAIAAGYAYFELTPSSSD